MASHAGKLAVVTGANSGIGWNTALELARNVEAARRLWEMSEELTGVAWPVGG
jgi:NAD(P)-dependent dehydrogenase (short-subunit alcohol dehydrogenase family)